MQIHNIRLINFKQYRDADINFPEGLIGFVGKNGAGKSTIFEAITNAFYGKFESVKDKIKNDKAADKDSIIISMTFEDKGIFYRVYREYRGKSLSTKAELFKNNRSIASGAIEVNRVMSKIIKIDYTNFKNSFFAHQKDVTSLLNKNTKERQVALRKMLGLEKMDKIEGKIKDEIKEQNAVMAGRKSELLTENNENKIKETLGAKNIEMKKFEPEYQQQKEKVENAEKHYNNIKNELFAIEKIKIKFDKIKTEIEIQNAKISDNDKNISNSIKELSLLYEAKKEYEELLPLKEKYEKINKHIELLQNAKLKYHNRINLEKAIRSYKVRFEEDGNKLLTKTNELKLYNDISIKMENIKSLLASNRETLNSFSDNRDSKNKIIGSIKDQLSIKNSRISKIKGIGKDSKCPECERPLKEHYDLLLGKYKNEIVELQNNLNFEEISFRKLKIRIDSKEKEIDKLNNDLSEQVKRSERKKSIETSIKELNLSITSINIEIQNSKLELEKLGNAEYNDEDLVNAQEESRKLKKNYERCLSLGIKKDEIPGKVEQIKYLQKNEIDLKEKLKQFETEKSQLKFYTEEYERIKLEREMKEDELNEMKGQLHIKQVILNEINNEIKKIVLQLNDNKKRKERIDLLQRKINLFDRLKLVVNEFKEKITSRELPEISKAASSQFSTITRGRYDVLKIDNSFNLIVNRDGNEVDLNTLSGGEKDLASLCLRIAISKRISKLAGRNNMGFLALDEVFGSQDEERREELLNALNLISREFKQIFVVSHNQDVQEKFPVRLSVTKRGDFSFAEVVS